MRQHFYAYQCCEYFAALFERWKNIFIVIPFIRLAVREIKKLAVGRWTSQNKKQRPWQSTQYRSPIKYVEKGVVRQYRYTFEIYLKTSKAVPNWSQETDPLSYCDQMMYHLTGTSPMNSDVNGEEEENIEFVLQKYFSVYKTKRNSARFTILWFFMICHSSFARRKMLVGSPYSHSPTFIVATTLEIIKNIEKFPSPELLAHVDLNIFDYHFRGILRSMNKYFRRDSSRLQTNTRQVNDKLKLTG